MIFVIFHYQTFTTFALSNNLFFKLLIKNFLTMMFKGNFLKSIGLTTVLAAAMFLQSCEKENGLTQSTLRFTHKVGTSNVIYDSLMYTNEASNLFSVTLLRYFISDVVLHNTSGDTFVIDTDIYVDARDTNTLTHVFTTEVPNKTFTHLTFNFGFSNEDNVSGMYPSLPESGMVWPDMMGGGYHYMKFEGKFLDNSMITNFKVHTGMLNGNANYFTVTLPLAESISSKFFDMTLVMDLNNWFRTPNTFDLANIIGGMMGNQTAQTQIQQNGQDVFSVIQND